MNDVERYGIEVGDVWEDNHNIPVRIIYTNRRDDSFSFCIIGLMYWPGKPEKEYVRSYNPSGKCSGGSWGKYDLKTLISRDGKLIEREPEYVDVEPILDEKTGMMHVVFAGCKYHLFCVAVHKDFVGYVWGHAEPGEVVKRGANGWYKFNTDGTREICKAVRFRKEG